MVSSTSAAYDAAIDAPVRRTVATVGFDLAAPEAKRLAALTVPPENEFSRAGQLLNNIEEIGAPIATFEPGQWRLDGSFVLPVPPGETDYELGWWGRDMSGGDGLLPVPYALDIAFPVVQKIPSLGLAFDTKGNCAMADFAVSFYGSDDVLLYSESFAGNTNCTVQTTGGAEQTRRIRVEMTRTAVPYRFPRICEISFGLRLRFDGADLIKTSLVTEGDPTGESIPFPRLRVTVRNDGRFNFLENEDMSKYLQNRQAFEYHHGVILPDGGREMVYGGAYYLEGWRVSDERIEFDAAGASSVLENTMCDLRDFATVTVGTLAELILAGSGLSFDIDESLYESPPVCAYLGETSARQALTGVAKLGCALVYENRQNTIRVQDMLAAGAAADTIDYDNMLAPPVLTQSPYYNGVTLTEYTARTGTDGFDRADVFYPAPWYDATEQAYGCPVDLPCMVVNRNPQYEVFRAWFLERKFALLSRRITAEAEWRQNPALCVGDTVVVQADKRGQRVNACTIYNTLEYAGGVLSGTTRALLLAKGVEMV